MKARHAARELALLALYQLGKQDSPESPHASTEKSLPDKTRLDDLMVMAARALAGMASDQIEDAAKSLATVRNALTDIEREHPDNLATPLDAPPQPVPLPDTRQVMAHVDTCLQAAENLWEALRLPELLALAKTDAVKDYALTLVELTLTHQAELDPLLEAHCEEWKLSRLVELDRWLLRLSAAEMKYVPDVDVGVSIDEAVELAKQFSTEDSYKFINGVLGNVAKELAGGLTSSATKAPAGG